MGYFKRRARNKTLETPATYGFEAVDRVRDRLMKTNYKRFAEDQLVNMVKAQKFAVWNSSFDRDQLAEEAALDQVLIDMRVPQGALRREASQWWLDQTMNPDSDVYRELKSLDAAGKLPPTREFYGN